MYVCMCDGYGTCEAHSMASCCISSDISAFLIMAFFSRTPLFSTNFSAMYKATVSALLLLLLLLQPVFLYSLAHAKNQKGAGKER